MPDEQGALQAGAELGWLPLALAQVAAVIAAQHLDYGTYLARLRSQPAREFLGRVKGGPYPHGAGEAITPAVVALSGADEAGLRGPLLDLVAFLLASGVRRDMLRAQDRVPTERATQSEWFEVVERATPRERSVFGWPAPGDPYWDEQTLADTQTRYPRADLTPHR